MEGGLPVPRRKFEAVGSFGCTEVQVSTTRRIAATSKGGMLLLVTRPISGRCPHALPDDVTDRRKAHAHRSTWRADVLSRPLIHQFERKHSAFTQ